MIFQILSNTMDYEYRLMETHKIFDENIEKIVYGIEIKWGSNIKQVEDISTNKEQVLILLEKCKYNLCSPYHIEEIIEDFILF
ncbi:MAG: hypothetical protein A2Y17_00665 [Clostridiales bacterium GWF2_38_85]|nr:MAG: hypothetical protein A2Y17_00665 [Clostridiales bacterium GWF2_38_85]